jgi:restriction system protein
MSIFAPSKNDAVTRLERLLADGADPGAVSESSLLSSTLTRSGEENAVDEPEQSAEYRATSTRQDREKDRGRRRWHALAALVTAILEADGYQCIQAPPGPDGGIDITAGRGPLGLDSPRVLVQVKSGAQVGSPVVTQLHGVMSTHGAEQGLLVAWGGLTKPARDALKNQHLRVRVWESTDVMQAVLRTYDRLPETVRTPLPLRRVWMLG